jgi:hypothetical protein
MYVRLYFIPKYPFANSKICVHVWLCVSLGVFFFQFKDFVYVRECFWVYVFLTILLTEFKHVFPQIAKLFSIFQIVQNVWYFVWEFSNISTTYQPYELTKFRDTRLKSWVVLKVHLQSYQTCQFKFQITTSVCVCVCVCVCFSCF